MWAYLVLPSVFMLFYTTRFLVKRHMEESFFEFPKVNTKEEELAKEKGIQKITFNSGNDVLEGNWLEVAEDAPAVFICHGNGEYVGNWLGAQLLLKQMGYSSFVFDYAGFGNSKGKTAGYKMNFNAYDAWCTFCKLTVQSTSRVALGHSMGGAVLLSCLSHQMFFPDRLVLHGVFSSARNLVVHLGILTSTWAWIMPDVWNNVKNIRKIVSIPIKMVHSKDDELVPFAMAEYLAYKKEDAEFETVGTYAHDQLYQKPDTRLWKTLLS